jgi:hypothetical protein
VAAYWFYQIFLEQLSLASIAAIFTDSRLDSLKKIDGRSPGARPTSRSPFEGRSENNSHRNSQIEP